MRVLAVVVLAGCFHPSIPSGAPCAEDGSCPGDLMCREGRCESDQAIDASSIDSAPDSSVIDAAIDAPPDAPIDAMIDAMIDAPVCVTFSRQFETCTLAAGAPLSIAGTWTYDTDLHELRNAGVLVPVMHAVVPGKAGPIEALLVTSFDVSAGSSLRVTGAVPFGIVAGGPVSILGTIDASSGGAGHRTSGMCGAASGQTTASHGQGPGGGGGGAFRGAGGSGSIGDANGTMEPGGVAGVAVALPLGPLGGCPGGAGANGAAGTAGFRGSSGGAIYIVGSGSITVGGTIHVGGGGGGHGDGSAGSGGGGGSGGMILLEGASVTVSGTLAANGGGGGGGADNAAGADGSNGSPGTTSTNRANGGASGGVAGEGGIGGQGGAGAGINGLPSTTTPDNGGGGGGGGVGYISIIGTASTGGATITPSLTPFP